MAFQLCNSTPSFQTIGVFGKTAPFVPAHFVQQPHRKYLEIQQECFASVRTSVHVNTVTSGGLVNMEQSGSSHAMNIMCVYALYKHILSRTLKHLVFQAGVFRLFRTIDLLHVSSSVICYVLAAIKMF